MAAIVPTTSSVSFRQRRPRFFFIFSATHSCANSRAPINSGMPNMLNDAGLLPPQNECPLWVKSEH